MSELRNDQQGIGGVDILVRNFRGVRSSYDGRHRYLLPLYPEVIMKFIDTLHRFSSALRHLKYGQDKIFHLPIQPLGTGDTERCIEIPWAFSCYSGEQRVLDVGYANAEDRYLTPLLDQGIPELYGLDMVNRAVPGIISVAGDMRMMPFRDGVFDLIFCISTIEHVGWDNTIYYHQDKQVRNPGGDLQAIRELARITRKGGRIVVTVPYGMLHNYGWFIQYDRQCFDRLINASGCRLLRKDLFLYHEGWHKTSERALKGVLYKDNSAPAAAGLACVLLER